VSSHYRMRVARINVCSVKPPFEEALGWLADHAKTRTPVFAEAEVPATVLKALDRNGLVIRVPGNVVVLISPGDNPDAVIQSVLWQIVQKLTDIYHPAVVERDSAVRLHLGRTNPGPEIRIRQTGQTRWRKQLAPGVVIRVERGEVTPGTQLQVGEATIPVDPAEKVLLSLPVKFLREALNEVATWLKSLILSRPAIIEAYRENPRPVVLKRIEDIARDVGNERLADQISDILANEQNVRIGRDRTLIGRELVVADAVTLLPTTHQPWLDRLALMIDDSIQQVERAILAVPDNQEDEDLPALLEHARSAKVYDAYHSSSIEGYRLKFDEVASLLTGKPGGASIEDIASRLAIEGYSIAFDALIAKIERDRSLELSPAQALDLYSDLFTPTVEAGLLEGHTLRNWRTGPVYIRNTLYVPPNSDKVPAMMDLLFARLSTIPVQDGLLRAILVHLWFVWIHPFPDGNGRVARFLMNGAFLSANLRWLTIRVDQRDEYFAAVKTAQLDEEYGRFADFILRSRARTH
jgi:Fic family protein